MRFMLAGQGNSADDSILAGPGQKRFRNLAHMITETLTAAGVQHIAFNQITPRNCVKELKRIAAAEGISITDETLNALVKSSQQDLFNAIQSLRMHVLGTGVSGAVLAPGGARSKGARKAAKQAGRADPKRQQRDMGLDIFHALGKILYNKRYNAAGEVVSRGPRHVIAALHPVATFARCRVHVVAASSSGFAVLVRCSIRTGAG